MENLTVIIFNGIGMLACFVIGLIIAKWGYSVYNNGVSSKKDTQLVEWGNVKITSKGGGSIIMSSAVVWAIVGFNVSPSITQTEHGTDYTSILNDKNENFAIVSGDITNPTVALKQPVNLISHLSRGLNSGNVNTSSIIINGLSGEIDGEAINYFSDYAGNVILTAKAAGDFGDVIVWFEPSIYAEGQVVFKAKGFSEPPGLTASNPIERDE